MTVSPPALALAVVLALTACSGGDETADSTVVAPTTAVPSSVVTTIATPTTAAAAVVTTAPSPATTALPPAGSAPSTAPVPGEPTAALQAWQQTLTTASAGGDLTALASPVAASTLASLAEFIPSPLTFSTTATAAPDGTVAIEECVLPAGGEAGALLVRGVVTADGVVDGIDIADAFEGCVPAAVNTAVLAAYEDFWNAFTEFTRPPDPASVRLAGTTNGEYFTILRDLMARFAAEGKEFRGRPQTRPEVEAYLAVDRIRIGDCQVMPADFGVYATATGQRTTDWPAIREGQTDYRSVTMVLVDGTWKVDGVLDETDSPCQYPSPRAAIVSGAAG